MEQILIDTSVAVRYLKSADGILSEILGNGYELVISAVLVTELTASRRASDKQAHRKLLDFVQDNFKVIAVDEHIASRAGDLIRTLDITLGQALVAATALHKDLPLLTYELKVFDSIPNLKLIDI